MRCRSTTFRTYRYSNCWGAWFRVVGWGLWIRWGTGPDLHHVRSHAHYMGRLRWMGLRP